MKRNSCSATSVEITKAQLKRREHTCRERKRGAGGESGYEASSDEAGGRSGKDREVRRRARSGSGAVESGIRTITAPVDGVVSTASGNRQVVATGAGCSWLCRCTTFG